MKRMATRGWRRIGAILALSLALVSSASSALINLQAYILYALVNNDGTMPLADGSLVQIIGSYDAIANPMETYGSSLIAEPTGDDLIIATITIQSSILSSNGTFYSGAYYYQSDEVRYMYLRFYDSPGPLVGDIYWGQSPVTNAEHDQFGGLFMDFVGGYATDHEDNFVVIPEPGTLNLMLVWATTIAAMRSSVKRGQKKPKPSRKKKKKAPPPEFIIYDRF